MGPSGVAQDAERAVFFAALFARFFLKSVSGEGEVFSCLSCSGTSSGKRTERRVFFSARALSDVSRKRFLKLCLPLLLRRVVFP